MVADQNGCSPIFSYYSCLCPSCFLVWIRAYGIVGVLIFCFDF